MQNLINSITNMLYDKGYKFRIHNNKIEILNNNMQPTFYIDFPKINPKISDYLKQKGEVD